MCWWPPRSRAKRDEEQSRCFSPRMGKVTRAGLGLFLGLGPPRWMGRLSAYSTWRTRKPWAGGQEVLVADAGGCQKVPAPACGLWPAKSASVRESSVGGSEQGNAGGEPVVRQHQTNTLLQVRGGRHPCLVVNGRHPSKPAPPTCPLASFKVTSPAHSAQRQPPPSQRVLHCKQQHRFAITGFLFSQQNIPYPSLTSPGLDSPSVTPS